MKKTTLLAIFAAGLVGATYYFEFYQAGKEEALKSKESKVVSFPADQIHQVEIENKFGKILLKRDTEGWRLEEPVKDWADNQFVEDFVNGLSEEKSTETLGGEGEEPKWSLYGLDHEVSKVVFTSQQGSSVLIQVSAKKNFEGNSFLRRGNENKVLVGTSQWNLRSQKSPLDFRDKRLFRGKIGSVEGMTLKSQKEEFELINKENKWISIKHPDLKLDQNKVREILTSLNEVHASDFLDKIPVHQAGKGTSNAHISLKLKDKIWSAELKQSAVDKSIVGVTSEPQFILKLEPGQVNKFFGMTLMELRDRKEPFDFPNLSVRRIEIQTKLKKMILNKEKETWSLEGNTKSPLDQNAIRNFIMRLSDSSVTEYLEKREQAGFQNPENKIILKGEGGKLLYDLSWGPSLKKKALTGEKVLVLAQANLFKDVFGLEPSVIESWGLMGLFPKDTP
ncbi:MAG: DUF4340 domain-containing protein [Pseudobdellovibrionaceae bacterium]